MAATDFVVESQLDSLTTNIATEVKTNKTASDATATALTTHETAASAAHTASAISLLDAAGDYTATDVEAALAEVKLVADAAAGGGISINDSATNTTNAWSSQKISDEIVAAVNALIDGAPGALDTLNELAAALNDNASFASAITTSVDARLRFDAAQALTGPQQAQALSNLGVVASTQDFAADFNTAVA